MPTAELAFDVGVQEVELLDWREGQAFLFHFLGNIFCVCYFFLFRHTQGPSTTFFFSIFFCIVVFPPPPFIGWPSDIVTCANKRADAEDRWKSSF